MRMRQQELEAKATQAAQKFQAQQGYQQAVASGMDPTQAILKFGPAMGAAETIPSALRAQQMAQRPQKQPFVPGPVKSFANSMDTPGQSAVWRFPQTARRSRAAGV